jgi:DNA polymerase-3 subunit beta
MMRLSCTKENLTKALSLVSGAAGKNINLPILSNVLFKVDSQKAELISTNLELAIVVNLRSKIETPGSFTVPAKTLTDFVGLLSDDKVDLEQKDNELIVKCGKSSTKIKGTPADEFPVVPTVEGESGFLVEAAAFRHGLTQVTPAIARNDVRPELSGVCFVFNQDREKELVMAATDSYRLAEKRIKFLQGDHKFRIIVPNHTAHEIGRILSLGSGVEEKNVRILISENQFAIHYNGVELVSRLVEGQYPDYTQIIPKAFRTTAVFSTSQMVKEIKAASLFTTTGVNAVNFDLVAKDQVVKIASTSTQTGEYASEIEAEVQGEDNTTLLNHRYLLDGLNNMGTAEVEMKVINGDSPCILAPKGDETYLYIVMPIRK